MLALFDAGNGNAHLGGSRHIQGGEPHAEGAAAIGLKQFLDLKIHDNNGNTYVTIALSAMLKP